MHSVAFCYINETQTPFVKPLRQKYQNICANISQFLREEVNPSIPSFKIHPAHLTLKSIRQTLSTNLQMLKFADRENNPDERNSWGAHKFSMFVCAVKLHKLEFDCLTPQNVKAQFVWEFFYMNASSTACGNSVFNHYYNYFIMYSPSHYSKPVYDFLASFLNSVGILLLDPNSINKCNVWIDEDHL